MTVDVYAFVGKLNDANAFVVVTTQGVVVVTGNNPPETCRRVLANAATLPIAKPALRSPGHRSTTALPKQVP